jgi:hypothetical protein
MAFQGATSKRIRVGSADSAVHANVTIWLITEIARKSDSIQAFLQSWRPGGYRDFFRYAAPTIIPVLKSHGLLFSFAIRTQVDRLTVVSIFADEAGADAGWDEITGNMHELMDGYLELVDRTSGPVEDLVQIAACGPCWPPLDNE